MASKFFGLVALFLKLVSSNPNSENFYYGNCEAQFEANPSDCSTYFQCNYGYRILRNCPTTLFWNPRISACDWASNAREGDCANPISTNPAQNKPPPKPNDLDIEPEGAVEIPPSNQLSETCSEGSLTRNPQDCSSYYVCNHGKFNLQQCGAGLDWNERISSCDWPSIANCDADEDLSGESNLPGGNVPEIPPAVQPAPVKPPAVKPPAVKPPAVQPAPVQPAPVQPAPVQKPLPAPSVPSAWKSGLKLVCYFTGWAWYRPLPSGKFLPSNIDPTLCTHIVYAFALLNGNDFILQPADSWADFDNYFYQNVTSLKSTGAKVTLALGGWNDSAGSKYSELVNSPANRARFITSTVAYLKKYNFDGLDLDWEYPSCWQGNCKPGLGDKAGFAALVRELRAAFPPGYILSAAVSASKPVIDAGYDVPTLSKYLDWIGVMNYDFHGNWDKQSGHIAPLHYMEGDAVPYYNVNSSISYWIQSGAAPEKLVLGIPLYGQSFTLASSAKHGLNAPTYGGGEAGTFTRQSGVLAYYEICSQKWNIVQDPKGRMGPYGYNGNQWVSYDDVPMVIKKANYAKAHGLGGGMIWALDMDDFTNLCGQGKYPLLTAIANTLKN